MSLKRRLLLALVLVLAPSFGAAQIAAPGDLDTSGRVYTEIVARVGEAGTMSAPMAGLTLYVVSEDGKRVTLQTNRIGIAGTWLERARYRVVTPEPYQYEGRLYTWDTLAVVRPGSALIRLQLANAKSSSAVPTAVWKQGEAGSGEMTREGRTFKTLLRNGVAINAAVSRNRELMWADIVISNGSNRKIEVDPATFTLSIVSPTKRELNYRAPTGELITRALTANTLAPSQNILGTVFFERDKNAHEVILRVPLTGITFELPFELR
jgi:hypothetical protein